MPIEDTLCPECGLKMVARNGKFGKFWGCSNYPECKGTRDSLGRSKAERDAEKNSDREDDFTNDDRYRFRKQ